MELTPRQADAMRGLVRGGRLRETRPDSNRASTFLRQAGEAIDDLPRVRNAAVKYAIAYDAMHDVGEALLAVYGFRTANGIGQHETIGKFLVAVLDSPPADRAAREFDRMRRARNQSRYEAKPIGSGDASQAVRIARDLHQAAAALRAIP